MASLDLALDDTTGDIKLDSSGNGSTVSGAVGFRQRLLIRLRTERGTWFYDTSLGTPWLSKIIGRRIDAAVLNSLFAESILGAPGAAGYSEQPRISFDNRTRIMTASFKVRYKENVENEVVDVEALF